MTTEDDEIPDEVFDAVKAIVDEIGRRANAGTLSKDQYKRLRNKAKKAAGEWWGDVAEAVENLKP